MKKSKEHLVANTTNNSNKKDSLWAPVKHVIFRRVSSVQTTYYSVHQKRKRKKPNKIVFSFFLFICYFKFSRLPVLAHGVLFSLTHGTVKPEEACLHTSICSAGKSLLEQKSLLHDNDVRPVKRRQ